jgi:DMSO/TMAO reductase YedYZ molybdopterin-dependent catalytic subunit
MRPGSELRGWQYHIKQSNNTYYIAEKTCCQDAKDLGIATGKAPSTGGEPGRPHRAAAESAGHPAPTPILYPGHAQEEPETGLHVTGGAAPVDLPAYRLRVSGLVDRTFSLSHDDLRCLPVVEAEVMLVCPGCFVDTARLAGPILASIIALAEPQPGATEVTLISVTGYSSSFPLAQVEENFLAHEWRGEARTTNLLVYSARLGAIRNVASSG